MLSTPLMSETFGSLLGSLLFVFDSIFEATGYVVVVASPPYQRPSRQAGKSCDSCRFS